MYYNQPMNKKRKTREQKIRTTERKIVAEGFRVNPDWLAKSDKNTEKESAQEKVKLNYFKLDLTKTFVLTMLVLAFELALWQWLARR